MDLTFDRLLSTSSSTSTSSTPLGFLSLFLALLCPILVVVLSLHLQLNIAHKIIVSVIRTVVQLLLAGYLLLGFIFDIKNQFVVLCYLLMMIFIATIEVTSRTTRYYENQFRDAFISVFVGGGFVGLFGSVMVFHANPWWEPHIVVPTAGMIIGNL
jgi:putative ABC transport system permease protein